MYFASTVFQRCLFLEFVGDYSRKITINLHFMDKSTGPPTGAAVMKLPEYSFVLMLMPEDVWNSTVTEPACWQHLPTMHLSTWLPDL